MKDKEMLNAAYRYAISLTGNRADAEDVVHDAFLQVYKKYGPLRNKYLLYRSVKNRFIDNYRKKKPFTFEELDKHPELSSPEPEELDLPVTKEEVKSAMDTLRPEERQAIYLNYFEGYSAAKIAKLNNMPRSTVLSLLQRGKKKIGKALRTLSLVKDRRVIIKRRFND